MKNLTVAIVGAGFSGIAVAVNLINMSKRPLTIFLIDKSPKPGVAFATENPRHPLNVRACHMSAFSDLPLDFYEWLQQNEKKWRAENPHFTNLRYGKESFLPRRLYGSYIGDLLTRASAKCKGSIQIKRFQEEALDADLASEGQLRLITDKRVLPCDAIVLAMGIPPFKSLPFETQELLKDKRYIFNIWNPPQKSLLRELSAGSGNNETALIIGSGLSMVDSILGLEDLGFQGKFICLSANGKMPEVHREKMEFYPKPPAISPNLSILQIFKDVRKQLASAAKTGVDWRWIIDAIRPQIISLWNNLPEKGQREFLRHLFSIWNKYRHRMSPESYALIENLKKGDRFQLYKGKIEKIENSNQNYLRVFIKLPEEKKNVQWDVQYIINCTGPDYRIENQNNQFLHSLKNKQLIVWDRLKLGLKTTPKTYLDGQAPGKFYALGSLLFGEFLETTSVPEIREQACQIAKKILEINL